MPRPRVCRVVPLLLGLFLLAPGCSSSDSKVSAVLAEAEAELEKSEAALKALKNKPPREAAGELAKVYAEHGKMLGRLIKLEDERFTKEEKDRFRRVLAKSRERKEELAQATDEIRKRFKEEKKE